MSTMPRSELCFPFTRARPNPLLSLMRAYLSSHPAVAATYLLSGPLLASSTLAQTQVAANGGGPATQSLAHMSATQKIKIVDMDQMSDDERNSEADAEEEREEIELEHSEDKIAVDDQGAVVPEEVARWGVVLVGQDALDGEFGSARERRADV